MKALRNAIVRSDKYERIGWTKPITFSYGQHKDIPHNEFNRLFKHALTLTIGVEFWANQAQYNDALREAEKAIAAELFGEANLLLGRLARAVMAEDSQECFHIINLLRDELN